MEKYLISGGKKLFGEVKISPAKNACLPLIASTIMFSGEFLLQNAPKISDVIIMAKIVENLGGSFIFTDKGLLLKTFNINSYLPSKEICCKARASFFIAGALLSRFKRAIVPLPGGCNIGIRPVDVHIDAFNQLGVDCIMDKDYVKFDASMMKSGRVSLKYPSVGATVNAICACVGLMGESLISNCAKEPEIVDLCNFLNLCGAKISGIGTSLIKIEGIAFNKSLKIVHRPIDDRIEAGTFIFATAVTGGEIAFKYDNVCNICSAIKTIEKMGVQTRYEKNTLYVKSKGELNATQQVADVFPAFPTDLQSPLCSVCAYANGESVIEDRVFKDRFAFVKQLNEFGVKARVLGSQAVIKGSKINNPCSEKALDLRAGAGLVIYALGAQGESQIFGVDIIRRGYENLEQKLRLLGADMQYILS